MWCDLEKIIQGVGTAVYFCQLCKESSYSFGGFSLNWISTRISNAALLAEIEVFENVIVNRLDQQDLLTHHAALGVSGSQVEDRVSIYIYIYAYTLHTTQWVQPHNPLISNIQPVRCLERWWEVGQDEQPRVQAGKTSKEGQSFVTEMEGKHGKITHTTHNKHCTKDAD